MVLHNQIDGLFSSLDERAANDGLLVEGASEVAPEFKIAIIGDSTMQVIIIRLSRPAQLSK